MNFKDKLSKIKTIICLSDGVFTPGEIYILPGYEYDYIRCVHKRDTVGISLITRAGFNFIFLTGDSSEYLSFKSKYLGVKDVIINSKNRLSDIEYYCKLNKIELNEVMFIGDDLPDYKTMQAVRFSACSSTADPEIKAIADYVTKAKGGNGCIREIAELLAEHNEIDLLTFYDN